MFKKAYVYGTAKALRDIGVLKIADDAALEELAEAVAEELPGTEEEYMEPQPEAVTAELATGLIELANNLQASAEAAAMAADAATTIHAATAAGEDLEEDEEDLDEEDLDEEDLDEEDLDEEDLEAAALEEAVTPEDVEAAALADALAAAEAEEKSAAWRILRKLGLDAGSTVSGETTNTLEDSPTGEAKMEAESRPAGYANLGIGVQQDSGEGLVGTEQDRTGEGGVVVPDENSATETVGKSALWRIINALRKHGQDVGATLSPDKNTPDAAAGETVVEKNTRPKDYALTGVGGESDISGGEVGKEEQHPKQEDHEGDTNSAIKASEEQLYLQQLRRLGQKYASALPFYLSDVEKVAALQYLMGLSPTERQRVIAHIEKTGELPEGLREYVENRKEEKEEAEAAKPEEAAQPATPPKTKTKAKAQEKKEEKNAALLRRLRQLSRM